MKLQYTLSPLHFNTLYLHFFDLQCKFYVVKLKSVWIYGTVYLHFYKSVHLGYNKYL